MNNLDLIRFIAFELVLNKKITDIISLKAIRIVHSSFR